MRGQLLKHAYCKYPHCKLDFTNSFSFNAGAPPSKCRNYQEVRLQEQVARLAVGVIPRSMWLVLEDDLVDACKPGDDVKVW